MHRACALRIAPGAQHGRVSVLRVLSASSRRRFHSLGVSADLVERLRAMGIQAPSAAQRKAIPLVFQRQHDVVIAAETGGGKTLAYLIPLLERLRAYPFPLHEIHRPVALVLTTSQELVGQIHAVLQALDTDVARVTTALSSTQQQLPSRGCAVLLATPKALLRATQPKDFAFTQLLVVDEADMLLGGGFERDTKQIVATIRNQSLRKALFNSRDRIDDELEDDVADDQRQTVFSASSLTLLLCGLVYATIPDYGKRSVHEFIQYKFPTAQFAITDDFQRTLPRLEIAVHRLEDHASQDDANDPDLRRKELLLTILKQAEKEKENDGHTLVFANSIESADNLHGFLTSHTNNTQVLLYHKEISRELRHQILSRLQQKEGETLVVVCTDIAARGLDTTTVSHVVQYEFANDVVSYIHRIGRTARAGTNGKVSSIVSAENALVVSKIIDAGTDSLHGAFSRKRSLRKKVKKLRRDQRTSDRNDE